MAAKILIVDDEPDLLKTLRFRLQATGYEIVSCSSGPEAVEFARKTAPDIILLDVVMPGMDGFEVKAGLNIDPLTRDIPVIFLSADVSTDEKIKGLGLGAYDYMTKPFDPGELLIRIKALIDKKLYYEKLSMTDALTGLYNQAFFRQQLSHFFNMARRYKKTFSLAVIDIDDLKVINDTYGHTAGDRTLKEFSSIARQVMRTSDILARYGGDEFVILMPETGLDMAKTAVERLKEKIKDSVVSVADGKKITFTISAGLGEYDAGFNEEAELFDSADKKLYYEKAKKQPMGLVSDQEVLMDRKKILVVDDEPDFLKLLKTRLEATGYEVITASNGKDGIEKVKSEKPDAVLLDILMPKMDGLKALRVIRKYDKRLPVFMVTSYSDREKFGTAQELDASGFIVKTEDLGEELKSIASALSIADRYRSG